jgi:starch phosphorylase
LINASGRRVQLIFSGKAHPRDNPGKELIRGVIHMARQEPFRRSLVFIEDYDINVARYLVQGVDVWLNTPLRPMEASGTSGMKVAANGGLNVSVLDGWWAEGYDPSVGWAIGSGETYDDLEYQNEVESQALYDLLEKEIIPLFYDRGRDNLPRGWIAKMRAAMVRLAPVYNTNRMLRQYAEMFYVPAARQWDELTADDLAKARELGRWERRVAEHFPRIRIETVSDDMDTDGGGARVGQDVRVEALVDLGELEAGDVRVELYCGLLDEDGQLSEGEAIEMSEVGREGERSVRYATHMPCTRSGMTGYTVRVRPHHSRLGQAGDLNMIRWA